jgi:LacI family transcriptional regulator
MIQKVGRAQNSPSLTTCRHCAIMLFVSAPNLGPQVAGLSSCERSQNMKRNRITIEDIAKLSGVSRGTVSRVLNGGLNVSPSTQKRVLEVIERIGYQPNIHARRTAGGKSYTVSIILPMIGTEFYARLVRGIEKKLRPGWHTFMLFPLLSYERLAWIVHPDIPAYDTDGIIFCSLIPERLYPLGHLPIEGPIVLLDSYSPSYDSVHLDNELGGYLAGHHLAQYRGDIYVISMQERTESPFAGVFHERLKGFRRALEETGRELPENRIYVHDLSWSAGCLATREILQQSKPPVNIFAMCDLFALGVIEEVMRAGLQVGRDVRVIGFDDHPWTAEWGITTIHQPIEEMGESAAEILLDRLQGEQSSIRNICFKPELVVRQSA